MITLFMMDDKNHTNDSTTSSRIEESMKKVELESKRRTRTAAIGHIVNDDRLFHQLQAEMRERRLFTNDAVMATLHRNMLRKELAHAASEAGQQQQQEQSTAKHQKALFEIESRVEIDSKEGNDKRNTTYRSSLKCLEGDVMAYEDNVAPPPPSLIENISDQYKKISRTLILQGAKASSVRNLMPQRGSNEGAGGVKQFKQKENIRAMYRQSLLAVAPAPQHHQQKTLLKKESWHSTITESSRSQSNNKKKKGFGRFFRRKTPNISTHYEDIFYNNVSH